MQNINTYPKKAQYFLPHPSDKTRPSLFYKVTKIKSANGKIVKTLQYFLTSNGCWVDSCIKFTSDCDVEAYALSCLVRIN